MKGFFFFLTNLHNIRAICGSAEQPLLGPSEKALNQPKPHPSTELCECDFQWQADKICSKETPDWKALDTAQALTSWALARCNVRAS